ncbi:hypothetical protein [Ruegeria meonggei]|uniref:hypothetical protein n=1 Tax=Ruegeria meonggei TaxID=1446476 RepID=UPI00366A63D5
MSSKNIQKSNLAQLHTAQCNQLHEKKKFSEKPLRKPRRETQDNYAHEIARVDRFRVISCKDNIQWIIQKQNSGARSKTRVMWKAISYHRNRNSLISVWRKKTKLDASSEVLALPEHYSLFNQAY